MCLRGPLAIAALLLLYGLSTAQPAEVGKSFVVRKVIIDGNKRTQPYVFERFMDLKEGQRIPLSSLLPALDRNQKHLQRTALFNQVEVMVTRMVNDSIDIKVNVAERWYYFIYPYFELADRNFNEWWTTFNRDLDRTILGGTFYINNIRGRDEQLKLTAFFGFNQEFGLRYRQPFLRPGSAFGWQVEGRFWRTRNLAYATRNNRLAYFQASTFIQSLHHVQARLLWQPNARWKASIGGGYTYRQIADTIQSLNPYYLSPNANELQYASLYADLSWDNTDHIAYPLRGSRVRLQIDKLGLGFWQGMNVFRTAIMAGWYRPAGRNWFIEARAFAGNTIGTNRPYFLQRALGYDNQLVRGHELDVIDGQRYGVLQSAVKWRLINGQWHNKWMPVKQFAEIPLALFIRPHLDVGYTADQWNAEENPLHNSFLLGYGIGIDLVTYYDYAVSLNFSANRRGEKGLYLHVNF